MRGNCWSVVNIRVHPCLLAFRHGRSGPTPASLESPDNRPKNPGNRPTRESEESIRAGESVSANYSADSFIGGKTGAVRRLLKGEGCGVGVSLSGGLAALLRIGFRCWPLAARGICASGSVRGANRVPARSPAVRRVRWGEPLLLVAAWPGARSANFCRHSHAMIVRSARRRLTSAGDRQSSGCRGTRISDLCRGRSGSGSRWFAKPMAAGSRFRCGGGALARTDCCPAPD